MAPDVANLNHEADPARTLNNLRFIRVKDTHENLADCLSHFPGRFIARIDDAPGLFKNTLKVYFADGS